jgi:hypothetical protein
MAAPEIEGGHALTGRRAGWVRCVTSHGAYLVLVMVCASLAGCSLAAGSVATITPELSGTASVTREPNLDIEATVRVRVQETLMAFPSPTSLATASPIPRPATPLVLTPLVIRPAVQQFPPTATPHPPAATPTPAIGAAVSVQGRDLANTRAFALRGGNYTVNWDSAIPPYNYPDQGCVMSLMRTDATTAAVLVNTSIHQHRTGETFVYGVKPGSYYLDVTDCGNWTISLLPQ